MDHQNPNDDVILFSSLPKHWLLNIHEKVKKYCEDIFFDNDINLESLEHFLTSQGFVCQTQRIMKISENYLKNLKHSFILLTFEEHTPVILDLKFKEHFIICRASKEYIELFDQLPQIFIGTWDDLCLLISIISREMQKSFKIAGLDLPPWRQKTSLLSKWRCAINQFHHDKIEEQKYEKIKIKNKN